MIGEVSMEQYITDEERVKCQKVADAFNELGGIENMLLLDAGRYGFVLLQYYNWQNEFEDVCTFTDSKTMFEKLWQEWFDTQLFMLAKDTPMQEMDYEDIFKCQPEEKQKKIMDMKIFFAEKAGFV